MAFAVLGIEASANLMLFPDLWKVLKSQVSSVSPAVKEDYPILTALGHIFQSTGFASL